MIRHFQARHLVDTGALSGMLLLSAVSLWLLAQGARHAFALGQWGLGGLLALAFCGALAAQGNALRQALRCPLDRRLRVTDGIDCLAVVAGALGCFALSVRAGLGPVLAAGLVGALAALVVPRREVPVYCGAFVGMSCPIVFPGAVILFAAALTAGVVYVATQRWFDGVGGKLGAIALVGCVTAGLLGRRGFAASPVPSVDLWVPLILCGALAAPFTHLLHTLRNVSAVMASALVGILGGLWFPRFFANAGAPLAAMAFCASFAGMAPLTRWSVLRHLPLIGALSALLFIFTHPSFEGAGGKLGMIAFTATLAGVGFMDLQRSLRRRWIPSNEIG